MARVPFNPKKKSGALKPTRATLRLTAFYCPLPLRTRRRIDSQCTAVH